MHPRRNLSAVLLVAAVAFGFPACDRDPQEKYVAELRSSNEVPPNTSTAVGRVVLLVSRDATYAEYSVEADGLSGGIQGGHFHRGAPGANGPVIVSFFATNGVTPGTTDLELKKAVGRTMPKEQLDLILSDLRAGNIYANIHTPLRPGGEIRGQMVRQ